MVYCDGLCNMFRWIDRASACLDMHTVFSCQKRVHTAQCAGFASAWSIYAVFVCLHWMGRWWCLGVSSPFHRNPPCCCRIPQLSGNDTSRNRMMDQLCKSSRAWQRCTYSGHHLLWLLVVSHVELIEWLLPVKIWEWSCVKGLTLLLTRL